VKDDLTAALGTAIRVTRVHEIPFSSHFCTLRGRWSARALLNWTQDDLVAHSHITKKTLADFERGAITTPRPRTLTKVTAASDAAGMNSRYS
jgi:hypothetical protein